MHLYGFNLLLLNAGTDTTSNKRRGRGLFHKGRDTLVSQFVVTGWSPRPRVVSQLPISRCPPY